MVSSQLKKASILLDSWFTGMDFPSAAVEQIAKAVSRRHLGHSMPVHFFIEPIIYQQDFKVSTLCARDSETHSKLRYGIELQIETGRAFDISKHSQRQPYSYQETLGRSFKSQ